jgi:2-polyprenyl-3-methyl-5-hydroxy-6-metoxy-1,4-benzoquinol methylase
MHYVSETTLSVTRPIASGSSPATDADGCQKNLSVSRRFLEVLLDLYRGYARYFRSLNRLDPEEFARTDSAYGSIYDPFLPDDPTARILDLGCGAGHFLHYVQSRGFSNHLGVEQDAEMAAFVAESVTPSVVKADMFAFLESAAEKSWSVVGLNDVLEHLTKTDAVRLLSLVRKVLRDEGRAFIKTINMSGPFAGRARYMDLTHQEGYTEESLLALLGVAKLKALHLGPEGPLKVNRRIRFGLGLVYRLCGLTVPRILTLNLVCIAGK